MTTIPNIKNAARSLAGKYDVVRLELFGSYANGTATEKSDADFLVQFSEPVPSIFKVMGFREELSRKLGISVDVVTLPPVRHDKLTVTATEKII